MRYPSEFSLHWLHKLRDAGFETIRAELGEWDAASLEALRKIAVAIEHFAREFLIGLRDSNRFHDALLAASVELQCIFEDGEFSLRDNRRDVANLEVVARVGAIDAVALHGVGVGDAGECADVVLEKFRPQQTHEATHHRHHIFALDETHLEIDLREFRLTICARIFIAQALADLQVSIAACDHENLLEKLRTLRQRVPTSFVQTAWHDEVARAFWRSLDEQWGLDFEEAVRLEVVTREFRHA